MITDKDRAVLKKFVFSSEWDVIHNLVKEMARDINEDSKVGDNEFETLKNVFIAEGKKQGMADLIQRIFDISKKANE